MDTTNQYDALLSLDMDELGIRPVCPIEKDLHILSDSCFQIEKSVDFTVFPAEIQLENNEKITTNDEDANNDFEIDPETGEKIFHKTPLPKPTDNWIEEYLSDIESKEIITNQTDLNFENLPLTFDENLNEQSEHDWFSNLIHLEQTNDDILTTDSMITNQITTTTTEHPQIIDETNHLTLSIDDEISMSSSTNDQDRYSSTLEDDNRSVFLETKLENNDIDENSMSQITLRRTSTRSNYQGQQDEDTLRLLNISLSLEDITQSGIEEYNNFLARLTHLTPEQLHLIKDIRRRGKNKIAAQNCRKRKAVGVDLLMEEVERLKRVKHELEARKREIQQQIFDTRNQYEYLHHQYLPDHQLPPAIVVK